MDEYKYLIDPESAGDRIRKIIQKDGSYIYKKYTGEDWKPDFETYNKLMDEKKHE